MTPAIKSQDAELHNFLNLTYNGRAPTRIQDISQRHQIEESYHLSASWLGPYYSKSVKKEYDFCSNLTTYKEGNVDLSGFISKVLLFSNLLQSLSLSLFVVSQVDTKIWA